MLSLERILLEGAVFTGVMSALVLLSLIINPRVWLQDYPEAIRQAAPPLTPDEKRLRALFMVPFLIAFLVVPFFSARAFIDGAGDTTTFLAVFLHTFALFNLFNLFDAVVIDWLFLGLVRPRFALIPEAREHPELLLDRRKAVGDWLKGIAFCAVGGAVVAAAAVLSAGL